MSQKIILIKSVVSIYEYANKKRAKWLLNNIENLKIRDDDNRIEDIKNYCKLILKSKNGCLEQTYSNDNGFGRLFLKNGQFGYQNMIREYRSILAIDDYYDLDIKNCQPTILNQYCQKNNIETYYLNKYVLTRDEILKSFLDDGFNKDDVKFEIIRLIYGANPNENFINKLNKKNKKFILKFQNEINEILVEIEKLNPDIKNYSKINEFLKDKKFSNIKGSSTAYLCQDIENKIINYAMIFLKKKHFDIGALCFDGLMIRNNLNLNNDIINELNLFIEKQLNYKIEFIIKPFEKIVDIPIDELNNDYISEEDTIYQKMKDEIEKQYFILKKPSAICYFDKDEKLIMESYSNMKSIILRDKIIITEDEKGKKIKTYFIDKWMEDPNRKIYDGLCFEPNENIITNNNYLNLFTGFKYDNINYDENIDINFVLDTMKYILQDGYEYILNWISHIIKFKTRTEQAPILYSQQFGVGKSTITILIEKLLGSKYCSYINKFHDIEKDFNGQFENKLFCYCDEIKAKSNDLYEVLKNIITQNKININKKGIEQYEISNYANYLFTTNNYNPVKISRNDRRLAIIQCAETPLTPDKYERFNKEINDDKIMSKLFNFFKNREIKIKLDLYISEHKRDIEKQYLSSPIQYLYKNIDKLKDTKIQSSKLFDNIKIYEKNKCITDCSSIRDMTIKLQKIGFETKHTMKGSIYEFEKESFLKKLKDYDENLYNENINNNNDDDYDDN